MTNAVRQSKTHEIHPKNHPFLPKIPRFCPKPAFLPSKTSNKPPNPKKPYPASITSHRRLHQRLAQPRHHPRQRDRSASPGPALIIHASEKLARAPGRAHQHNLQGFVPAIILDGNSQVWLHKPMETEAFSKINRARIHARLEG